MNTAALVAAVRAFGPRDVKPKPGEYRVGSADWLRSMPIREDNRGGWKVVLNARVYEVTATAPLDPRRAGTSVAEVGEGFRGPSRSDLRGAWRHGGHSQFIAYAVGGFPSRAAAEAARQAAARIIDPTTVAREDREAAAKLDDASRALAVWRENAADIAAIAAIIQSRVAGTVEVVEPAGRYAGSIFWPGGGVRLEFWATSINVEISYGEQPEWWPAGYRKPWVYKKEQGRVNPSKHPKSETFSPGEEVDILLRSLGGYQNEMLLEDRWHGGRVVIPQAGDRYVVAVYDRKYGGELQYSVPGLHVRRKISVAPAATAVRRKKGDWAWSNPRKPVRESMLTLSRTR